jgi:hypothetical protein
LFPARAILIATEDGALPERLLLDDTEVMPSLSLGDIIAEELNLQVPYGTAIVFVPQMALVETATAALRGATLGRIFAHVILEAVNRGSFPMASELDVIFRLGASAVATAARLEARSGQIDRAAFDQALARTLDRAMSGRASDMATVTLGDLRGLYAPDSVEVFAPPVVAFFPMSFEHWLTAAVPETARKEVSVRDTGDDARLRSSKI